MVAAHAATTQARVARRPGAAEAHPEGPRDARSAARSARPWRWPAITAGPVPSRPWLPNGALDRDRDVGQRVQARAGRPRPIDSSWSGRSRWYAGEVPGARGRQDDEGRQHGGHDGEARRPARARPSRVPAAVALPDHEHAGSGPAGPASAGSPRRAGPTSAASARWRRPRGSRPASAASGQVEARLHQVADQQRAHRHRHAGQRLAALVQAERAGQGDHAQRRWRTGQAASGPRRSPP